MLWKADQRKRDQGKDTEFEYRGQLLTETSIQTRIERKKFEGNPQGPLGILSSSCCDFIILIRAVDAETPRDIKYTTPRNPVNSPLENRSASVRTAQTTWTPPVNSNRCQPQMRLVWNGRTKADYQAQYEEGLGDERSGQPDEAEAKFRSALDGLDHLLSTTHPETVSVAYRLASFFAEQVRMRDADTVLDWLTQAHFEDFGLYNTRTLDHIVNVCEMLRNWARPGDSAEFLQQFLHESDKGQPQPNSVQPLTTSASRPTQPTSDENTATAGEQEQAPHSSIPSEGPAEPSLLQAQIRQVTSGCQAGEGAEAVLLRLIRHCEQFPDKLIAQSLLCYPALLDHYEDVEDVVKKSDALNRAEQAVWNVLRSENKRTRDDLIACLQLAKYLVKASRYERAEDIFSEIECDAQETFGSDHLTTIWFLEKIGTFYQNEGRWQDAAPRFEHALAARLSRYGERHESVRRLEAALENRYFEIYVPSKDEETSSYAESEHPIRRIPAPEFIFLGLPPRGRQTD
jgi:tetratricopeptide (TPR) repeat protein